MDKDNVGDWGGGGKFTENYKCSVTGILCLRYIQNTTTTTTRQRNCVYNNMHNTLYIDLQKWFYIVCLDLDLDFCVFRRNRQKSLNSFFLPPLVFSIFNISIFLYLE